MKQTANDWKLFKFNLSAFLSAARSITLVMQKEYAHAEDFKNWYKPKQEEMRKDELLTFLSICEIHQSIKNRSIPDSNLPLL
jgi:hypothetical protein